MEGVGEVVEVMATAGHKPGGVRLGGKFKLHLLPDDGGVPVPGWRRRP